MFDIREYIALDAQGRAVCPACLLIKGTGYKSKNLSVAADSGAYKCHRGCTSEDIRTALNQERDRIIPTAWAKPPAKAQLLTPQKVTEANQRLLTSKEPLQWLLERGIPIEAIKHYRLGEARSKIGPKHYQSIGIPIRADGEGLTFYQKKRIAPWLPEVDRPAEYTPWSQYGIPAMVYFTHKPAEATETYLCEGEWDAIRLGWEMRHTTEVAVACFTCGAGNIPPDDQLARLPGKVTVFYDLDDPGQKGSSKVQEKLKAAIATVPHPPDPKKGWDITDALNHGFTIGDISDAASKATPWSQPKKENKLRSLLLTNDELMASAQDYVEWLVPDILTANELFIVGMPPRGGKSLLCLTLALSVAIGGTFLDRPVTQGSVIYINMEDSPTKIKQRQIAQEWGEGLPVYWLDKFKLSELDELKELADEIPDLRLVVLDTFSRIRDDNQKESSAELGRTLEPLQEWAKERGICILITHHTSKAPTDGHSADPFDTLRGSTSIRATCRGAIVIVPGDGGYRLLAENGYSDRVDVLVRINGETLKWQLMGNWSPRIDGDMKAQILDHITLMGEGTVASIASALGFNAASVSTVMARLHRDGMVSKDAGKGRSPGIYRRSSNLLKLMEPQFEQQDIDTVSDTDLLKQDNLYGHSSRKVINGVESDHLSDHFAKNSPTQHKLFEQSYRPDGDSDVCSNSENPSLSYGNGPHVENTDLGLGGRCKYVGKATSMGNLCGERKLTIEAIDGDMCIVRAKGWAITQTIPKTDLKPCK
jgi:AAA domain